MAVCIACPHCRHGNPVDLGRLPAGDPAALLCARCGQPLEAAAEAPPPARGGLCELVQARLARGTDHLAAMPAVAQEALALARNPDCSLKDLERIVQRDPLLAGRLMRAANSAFYRGLQEARTIPEAVMRLGLKAGGSMIVAAGVKDLHQARLPALQERLRRLWRSAVAGAAVARELAAAAAAAEPEEAFLAGLVQDLGQVLTLLVLDDLGRRDPRVAALPDAVLDQLLLANHEALGADLLRRWGFPQAIAGAVACHHRPGPEADRLAWVLAATDLVVRKLGLHGRPPEAELTLSVSPPMHVLQLDDLAVGKLLVDLEDRVPALQQDLA